jgi:hypothetical protein
MSVSYVKMFNTLMDKFFIDLIKLFPRDNCIKINHIFFQGICKTSSKTPCNDFINGVIPFLDKIYNRDETFYTGEIRPGFLKHLKFNNLWVQLSLDDKNIVWVYINRFLLIGINIIQLSQESLQLINKILCN